MNSLSYRIGHIYVKVVVFVYDILAINNRIATTQNVSSLRHKLKQ
jgi:hypothetical protein